MINFNLISLFISYQLFKRKNKMKVFKFLVLNEISELGHLQQLELK
jgi:hypothetical protein